MKKLIFAMAVAAAGAAAAGVSFSYQGALKNADGTSIPEGERNKTIEFRLYEGPTDSNALWGLQTIVHLDENGLFNVELSDTLGTPLTNVKTNNLDWVLASYLGNSKTLYIGLNVVGSTGEIRPRQKLLNVPAAAFAADVAHAKNNFEVDGIATFHSAVNAKGKLTASKGLEVEAGGLTVSGGGLTVLGMLTASSFNMIPRGVIVMWSGEASKVPDGWALCDGTQGTPDLRGRFIVGASANSGEKGKDVDQAYAKGATGGESFHTLTGGEMPSHQHWINFRIHIYETENSHVPDTKDMYYNYGWGIREIGDPGAAWQAGNHNTRYYWDKSYDSSDKNLDTLTYGAGESWAHENRPPYYALCFIMKK